LIRVQAKGTKIGLEDHMGIIESYLNEYKKPGLTKLKRNSLSNIMLKYVVGSCFKKMSRRAFHWASCFMITSLSSLKWKHLPPIMPVAVKTDGRLSEYLRLKWSPNQTTGEWLMTFHPSKDSVSLDNFLALASGPSESTYSFDSNIAATFHSLLLSSLYFYLSSMMELKLSLKTGDNDKIKKYVGPLCNAIRIFFLVSQSNVMRAYFSFLQLPIYLPASKDSLYYKKRIEDKIRTQLLGLDHGWEEEDLDNLQAADMKENKDTHNYMEDFFRSPNEPVPSIYRMALMSFVDHYAGLRILERRCILLSEHEEIKLSLIDVKHPNIPYRSWEEMKGVIDKTCHDFSSTTISNPVTESQNMIKKIEERIDRTGSDTTDQAINAFKSLLKLKNPTFKARIHCESSLAAILCHLHGNLNSHPDVENLRGLFQASPSSYSSSFTP
jgi:hypothetical protein